MTFTIVPSPLLIPMLEARGLAPRRVADSNLWERLETYRRNAAKRWTLTLIFTMLILVGAVKMADRVVREMMAL